MRRVQDLGRKERISSMGTTEAKAKQRVEARYQKKRAQISTKTTPSLGTWLPKANYYRVPGLVGLIGSVLR